MLRDYFYKLQNSCYFSLCIYNYRAREFEPNWGHECMSVFFMSLSCLISCLEMDPSLIQGLSNAYKQDP